MASIEQLTSIKSCERVPFTEAKAYLRSLIEADVCAAYVDGLNDPEVNRFMTRVREVRKRCTPFVHTFKNTALVIWIS